MIFQLLRICFVLVAFSSSACVIDTVPLPENSKGESQSTANPNDLDPSSDEAGNQDNDSSESSPSAPDDSTQSDSAINVEAIYYSDSPIELIGAPGAVNGEGKLRIETPNSWAVEISTSTEGTFAVQIEAQLGETLLLLFTDTNGEEYSASIILHPGSVDAYSATTSLANIADTTSEGSPLSLIRDGNDILLQLEAGTLSPGIGVAAGNSSLATAAFSMAEADGSLELKLRADIGDELIIFAVEPAASKGGGTPIPLESP